MDSPRPASRRPARYAAAVAVCAALAAGCGEPRRSVFEEIGQLPSRDEFVEVQLGSFIIPVPIVLQGAVQRNEPDNLMQVELDLVAVVQPSEEDYVRRLKRRHNGRLRDEVIRVCRSTTRDDLMEPQKATLKAHLLDAVQPFLGGEAVSKLVVKRVNIEEL